MALQPFQDEHLNFFKLAFIVKNEFPKALRQAFRFMWDYTFGHLPGFQPWDDSIAVRNLFLAEEGGISKVPTSLSYEEWDCTALLHATIYARSFALPDSTGHRKTLSDLYVKPHRPAYGSFHPTVVSPVKNTIETFALAIDQLRLLRNSFSHSISGNMCKVTFDQYVQHARDAFKALGIKTDSIDAIGGLTESEFPTEKVRKLEQDIKKETQGFAMFLEGLSTDIDEIKVILAGIKAGNVSKEDIARLEQKINDLTEASTQDKPGEHSIILITGKEAQSKFMTCNESESITCLCMLP